MAFASSLIGASRTPTHHRKYPLHGPQVSCPRPGSSLAPELTFIDVGHFASTRPSQHDTDVCQPHDEFCFCNIQCSQFLWCIHLFT